jgi:hypothetical protein
MTASNIPAEAVVQAFEELRALIEEGESEVSGLDAAGRREGLDMTAVEDALEAMLWNDLRLAEGKDEYDFDADQARSIATFRHETRETLEIMSASFVAGVRCARRHDA